MERADLVEVGSFVFASACYCSFTAFLLVVSTNEIDDLAVDDYGDEAVFGIVTQLNGLTWLPL